MGELTIDAPRFLSWYNDEIDACNLCAALRAYGIDAFYRVGDRVYGPDFEPQWAGQPMSFCIYVRKSSDHGRAREFKRGLLAALAIKSDPDAFVHGVLAAAAIRSNAQKRSANYLPRNARNSLKIMAESGGFEPPVQVSPYNGLANRRLQPLGQLSGDVAVCFDPIIA
jgi:hypothetical protein